MENDTATKAFCTVCRKEIVAGDDFTFGGALICNSCTDNLKLKEMDTDVADELLGNMVDEGGKEALKDFIAIARSLPAEYGWNILAIVSNISNDIDEVQAQALLESSTMICGMTVIRLGEGKGEVDPGLLSLFLVLGQVIDLSLMKRIVLDKGLRTSNKLDEMILVGEQNWLLFDMVLGISHDKDPKKEYILASCLERLV